VRRSLESGAFAPLVAGTVDLRRDERIIATPRGVAGPADEAAWGIRVLL
jgi:hypothetical protein